MEDVTTEHVLQVPQVEQSAVSLFPISNTLLVYCTLPLVQGDVGSNISLVGVVAPFTNKYS